ncbi:MAG: glycoside hydrolase family 2 protein [Candidatus Helarchaeota archaeon]
MKKLLSGEWLFYVDFNNDGIKNKLFLISNIKNRISNFKKIQIPSSWNSYQGLEKYEGICWYFKIFEINELDENNEEFFLLFNGSNYQTKIWLNNNYIGLHEGGFLPFKFKIKNSYLKKSEKNYLAVQVDNIRKKNRIPSKLFDWYNWGGIYRDVFYEILPKSRIDWVHIYTQISKNSAKLICKYYITEVKSFNYELKFTNKTILKGQVKPDTEKGVFYIHIENPLFWSPDTPNIYTILLNFSDSNYFTKIQFGIREIKINGRFLYLNNKKIKLYGINLHEELIPFGRAIPFELRKKDLLNIKKLGFNAIRTAHYPHDESLLCLADKIGLLILEEIPVYWNINFKSPKVFKLAAKMIQDLIYRDFNHPSVIFWSVGNEIPIESYDCHKFILNLISFAKKIDPSRPISYVSSRFLSDHYRSKTDIATLNEYFGWYLLSEKNLNFILEMTRGISLCYNKPWFITEFGAGAKYNYHSNIFERFSEEKQASILIRSIEIFNSKDWISGWFIWIYRDFKSAFRDNKYQNGFNRKGIVSDKNEFKLIARLLPKILKKKRITRKFTFISRLAIPFGFFFTFVFKIINIVNILESKKADKFYSDKYKRDF